MLLFLGPYDEILYRIGTLGGASLIVGPQLYYLLKAPRATRWLLFLRGSGFLFSLALLLGVLRFTEGDDWGNAGPAQDVFILWLESTAVCVAGGITILSGIASHKRNEMLSLFRLGLELWVCIALLFVTGFSGYLSDSFPVIVLLFLVAASIIHLGIGAIINRVNRVTHNLLTSGDTQLISLTSKIVKSGDIQLISKIG